jgi:CHAT domain-containing protein/cytochrome c-type biogenesis protein CcmH/NrfG
LARPVGDHLTDEELDLLAAAPPGAGSGTDEIRQHLASCRQCCELARRTKAQRRMLKDLHTRVSSPLPGCPPELQIRQLCADLLPARDSEQLLRHAGSCPYCGPLLREYREDFSDDATPEEVRAFSALRSGEPEWQRRMAHDLASAAGAGHHESWFARLWPQPAWQRTAAAVAAAAVLALISGVWWYREATNSADRLLATAYSQRRTFELRFSGAAYGPFRQERGTSDRSRFDRPPALLEAEALIARNLAAHPDSAEWLQARARADLLDWHYDAAILSLKRALRSDPDSPSLLIDLASAYFQRAEATDRSIDYGAAIEYLGKALSVRPDDPVALFNRAIAYERMSLVHQAIADWEHFLKIDSTGPWASEARQRLAALRVKVESHTPANGFAMDAASFLRSTENTEGTTTPRVEDFLEAAIQHWLPAAFPEAGSPHDGESAQALARLASILAAKHRDTWLSDLLNSLPSKESATALRHLSRALSLNVEGKPAEAESESLAAERLFGSGRIRTGVLRSRLETVYARQRSIRADQCFDAATALTRDIARDSYEWMRVQLSIERGICSAMLGDFGAAKQDIDSALAASRTDGFGTLELRSLGMAAMVDVYSGNMLMSWSKNRSGLVRYWQEAFPGMRAYQFHSNLEYAAEKFGHFHLALGLAREAVLTVSATPNRSIEAMARFRLGSTASLANSAAEAEAQLAAAGRLFDALPQNSDTSTYKLSSEISRAQIEIQRGDLASPFQRLLGLRPEVARLPDLPVALSYFATLGTLARRRGDALEAQSAYRAALALIQRQRQSLRDEHERELWMRQSADAYRALVAIRFREAADPEETLQLWESHRTEHQLPANFRSVLHTLGSETVLSYAQSSDGLAIWVADDRGTFAHWTPVSAPSLQRLAQQFSERCADLATPLALIQQDGNQLYRWLIQPVEARLATGRTLVIEADGVISRIPMQALVDDAGRYLGDRYSLVWSPGVWLESVPVARRQRGSSLRALVVGAPVIEGDMAVAFPPLPDALREARAVAARFPGATLLVGGHATLEAVERELPAAEVFHFAGHGFINASGGGLVLAAPQGRNEAAVLDTARVVRERVARCRLAVLSACSTGTGESDELVDPESLASSFLRAGVPAVVAARWRIDSAVTSNLIDEFYEAFLKGQEVPQALHAAALTLRSRPLTGHPYYWAAFSAFGSRSVAE